MRVPAPLTALLLLALSACCGSAPAPTLTAPADAVTTDVDVPALITWEALGLADPASIQASVTASDGATAEASDQGVWVFPEHGWVGKVQVVVEVVDTCGQAATATFDVFVGVEPEDPALAGPCGLTLTWRAQGDPEVVSVAGSWNGWDPNADLMTEQADGTWTLALDLPTGAYPYKVVEQGPGGQTWSCDPDAAYRHCDPGTTWSTTCGANDGGCNSLVVVPDCREPEVELTSLAIDRVTDRVDLTLAWSPGKDGAAVGAVRVTLDGVEVAEAATWDGTTPLSLSLTELGDARHTVRVEAEDADGNVAEPLYVPFWTDDRSWDTGLLYFAFVDRFADGDASLNRSEGSSHAITDYLGGDWRGLTAQLDHLDALGVTAIWLTAPMDNPEGAWGDKCGANFTGFHGYWPSDPFAPEDHFGTLDDFRTLVDSAHARGMRVLVDWVANHVHTDHPYYLEGDDAWFHDLRICAEDDDGDGVSNWDQLPEECWFDPFLPDIAYEEVEPLVAMVDDILAWVRDYELDGLRVDAVKHMPHAVVYNLQSRILEEVEHRAAGGDEEFYTVGETFSTDRGLIGSYVNGRELDAQFDFNVYQAVLQGFARDELPLWRVEATWRASRDAYGPALMSTFLGNHDVERFITHAAGQVGNSWGDGPCPDGSLRTASSPGWSEPYERLRLAWTWLLTHEGLPLVYYGDELGLPGYADPDNRQLMRWSWTADEAATVRHVCRLGQARQRFPQLAGGTWKSWYGYDADNCFEGSADDCSGLNQWDVLAWARVEGADQLVAAVNRGADSRTLTNGLSFAGLTPGTTFLDVVSGETLTADGDSLSVTLGARQSAVLVAPFTEADRAALEACDAL